MGFALEAGLDWNSLTWTAARLRTHPTATLGVLKLITALETEITVVFGFNKACSNPLVIPCKDMQGLTPSARYTKPRGRDTKYIKPMKHSLHIASHL